MINLRHGRLLVDWIAVTKALIAFCIHAAQKRPDFKPFPGMTDLSQIYISKELFPMFSNRLLNSRRQEYKNVLQWSGFSDNEAPDPLAMWFDIELNSMVVDMVDGPLLDDEL